MSNYKIINKNKYSPIVISAEHTANLIPYKFSDLGLDKKTLNSSFAYDIGAKALITKLSRLLDCSAIFAKYSRLLIDLNRTIEENSLIPKINYGLPIPGNKNLSQYRKRKRIKKYYTPYHKKLSQLIEKATNQNGKVFYILIHSFEKELNGKKREFDVGLLWDKKSKFALAIKRIFREFYPDLKVEINKPYDLRKVEKGSFHIHGLYNNIFPVEIEINNKLLQNKNGINTMASMLNNVINEIINKEIM
jgi:predicted N-formylglutamate amidohydrolase